MFGKSSGESEAQTRRKRIYPKLQAQRWLVLSLVPSVFGPDSVGVAVAEWPTLNRPAGHALLEKAEIVRRVESLFALADSIESRHADATAQVDRTTQAIFANAFRGEL